MKDTDFIIKQGWMVSKLHLEGKALELYALIYGYTKDGESWYETNISNIMEWLMASERTVQNHLRALVDSRFVLRKTTGLGRSARLLLQANPEILSEMEKGAEIAPLKRVQKTTKKGAKIAPLTPEKGANFAPQYKRIKIKDNKSILLRADARTKEEEEFFKIFYFRRAAVPAAEVDDFVRWNETFNKDWETVPIKTKYYYATEWKLKHGERHPRAQAWLEAWMGIYNWAVENDPEAAPMLLDVRFKAECYTDHVMGGRIHELTVTEECRTWLKSHYDELVAKYLNPLVKQCGAAVAKWNIIAKS